MKTNLALSVLLVILIFSFEKGNAQAPNWEWAKSFGGHHMDYGVSIATDTNGNSYISGNFNSHLITLGGTTLINADSSNYSFDLFIVKYDASGNLVWSRSIGGTDDDEVSALTIDASGHLYITGNYYSPTIAFDSTTLTNAGSASKIFVAKYDTSGNAIWAKRAGNPGNGDSYSISVDSYGNPYLTGIFSSPTIKFGNTTLTNTGTPDVFVVKYDSNGNVIWAKSATGTGQDFAYGIAVDKGGNSYITGFFQNGAIAFDSVSLTNSGGQDIFIAKFDSSGNVLWAKSAGDLDDDCGYSITVDASGNPYITGGFYSPAITFGNMTLINAGNNDIFIAKYDSAGNAIWAKQAGGTLHDRGDDITADANGNIYLSGGFVSDSIAFDNTTLINAGGCDIFIAKFDTAGNLNWAKNPGGIWSDEANSISIDSSGVIYVTGYFYSPTIAFGTTTLTNAGDRDFFVAKLDNATGIAEHNPNTNLTLYPNPATDYITINKAINKKQVITISDITGKIIYSNTTLSDKTIINTKDFQQGVYAVQVQAGDAVQTRKIVVTR